MNAGISRPMHENSFKIIGACHHKEKWPNLETAYSATFPYAVGLFALLR